MAKKWPVESKLKRNGKIWFACIWGKWAKSKRLTPPNVKAYEFLSALVKQPLLLQGKHL